MTPVRKPRMCMQGPARSMTLRPVTKEEVLLAMFGPERYRKNAVTPTEAIDEWDKDHINYILGVLLPSLNMPLKVRRIATEAYLVGAEAYSDGSSVVPNSHHHGNIKDWQGVMHDYIFWLHHNGKIDAFKNVWGWEKANATYRQAWIADDDQWLIGWTWYTGLMIGSYPVWAGWIKIT